MTQTEFLDLFGKFYSTFSWTCDQQRISGEVKNGKLKGMKVNPITSVAISLGLGVFDSTVSGTWSAARTLGLPNRLVFALISRSMNGHAQVVRGKMRSILSSNSNTI